MAESDQGMDQRYNSLEAQLNQMRQQQEQVLGALNGLLNKSNQVKEEPPPNITGTEFLDNPAGVINDLVSRQIGKLKGDLDASMRPFAEFMTYNQREKIANDFLSQMDGNATVYKHIGIPSIRQFVRESIINAPNVNPQFVHAVYLTAVGHAFSSGMIKEGGSEPSKEATKEEKTVPAHLRPNGSSSSTSAGSLPELDENEKRIMRERRWSHARAAYMFQKISLEVYKKHEPDGKPVDFGA